MNDLVGRTISHYHIIERIGEGGMGVVYKAEDTRLHRTVALKFLTLPNRADVSKSFSVLYEAQAASALEHPNVCNIHEIDTTETGEVFLVMAHYTGEPLDEILKKKALSISEIIDFATQIASGLCETHKENIIHCDLKPGNIFITERGEVKILDFGLAKFAGHATGEKEQSKPGTPAYTAPETILEGKLDKLSDVWSFGVVLYEMITGRQPFQAKYAQAVYYSILHDTAPAVSTLRRRCPKVLADLVARCMCIHPEVRIASMEEVLSLLEAIRERQKKILYTPVRWLYASVFVLILSSAVFMYFKFFVKGDGGGGLGIQHEMKIAVLPVNTEKGRDAGDAMLIQGLLVNNFTRDEDFAVIDPSTVNYMLFQKENNLHSNHQFDVYQKLRQMETDFIVDGDLQYSNGRQQLTLRLVKSASNELVYQIQKHWDTSPQMSVVIDTMSASISSFLSIHILDKTGDKHLVPFLGTKNIEALQAMIKAERAILASEPSMFLLEQALAADSAYIAPRVWMISGIVALGRYKEAKKLYLYFETRKGEIHPFEQAMIDWAGAHIAGDLLSEGNALERALRYSSDNYIVLVNLASTRYMLKQYREAMDALLLIKRMEWPYPPYLALLAACEYKLGRYKESRATLDSCLSNAVVDNDVYSLLALHSLRAGHQKDVLAYEDKYFEMLRGQKIFVPQSYLELAKFYLDFEEAKRAMRYLDLATGNMRELPLRYQLLKAQALLSLRDTLTAVQDLKAGLVRHPRNSEAHFLLGKVFYNQGEMMKSLFHLRKCLETDSTGSNEREVRRLILTITQ